MISVHGNQILGSLPEQWMHFLPLNGNDASYCVFRSLCSVLIAHLFNLHLTRCTHKAHHYMSAGHEHRTVYFKYRTLHDYHHHYQSMCVFIFIKNSNIKLSNVLSSTVKLCLNITDINVCSIM